jgi:hypothetical protein
MSSTNTDWEDCIGLAIHTGVDSQSLVFNHKTLQKHPLPQKVHHVYVIHHYNDPRLWPSYSTKYHDPWISSTSPAGSTKANDRYSHLESPAKISCVLEVCHKEMGRSLVRMFVKGRQKQRSACYYRPEATGSRYSLWIQSVQELHDFRWYHLFKHQGRGRE